MVLVVFPFRTTKGLDRELLVWLLYLLAIGQKCSNYQPSQYVEQDFNKKVKVQTKDTHSIKGYTHRGSRIKTS